VNPFSPRCRARYRSDRHRYTSVKTLTKLKLSPSAGVSMRCRLETTEQQVNRVLAASSRPVSVLLDANASLVVTLNSISRLRRGAAGNQQSPGADVLRVAAKQGQYLHSNRSLGLT
jgi:hypothetical protein